MQFKTQSRLLFVSLLLLVACQPILLPAANTLPDTTTPLPRATPSGTCGDGICNGPETSARCPADCPAEATGVPPQPAKTPSSGNAPLYLTTMTHMESKWEDDTDQTVFLQHVEQIRYGLGLANEYGARFTIESELPFANGARIWGVNILQEVLQLGHGVGTHSDINPQKSYTLDELTREFTARKTPVDALVGAENNRGTSGGGCPGDWVIAAHQAGFVYMDGVVGMHLLGVPLSARPSSLWTDEYILSVGYHQDVPVELIDRIYPILLADTKDFVPDANGVLLILSGDIGRLDYAAEGGADNCGKNNACSLTNADADSIVDQIRYADSIRDRTRIAKLTIFLPADLFQPANEGPLRYFLQKMKDLADEGTIVWATQGQVYDAYRKE